MSGQYKEMKFSVFAHGESGLSSKGGCDNMEKCPDLRSRRGIRT